MSERSDFGDVTAEYRAARNGTGLVVGQLSVVWVSGPDAISFLDGQVSQDLTTMESGEVRRSLVLEPRGKLVAIPWILRGTERVGLVVDAGSVDSLVARLETFRFRVDAAIDRDERAVTEVWGTGAGATLASAGLDGGSGWSETSETLTASLPAGPLERRLLVGEIPDALLAATVRVGRVASDSVRVEAGQPVMGVDFDESTIPHETGLVAATVSFTKGCYVGQELVARIDSRGHVNRRLVGFAMRTNVVPPVGAGVVAAGEVVGRLTTVGESLQLRAPVGMGLLRREVVAGEVVEIAWDGGGAPAVVRDLPVDDFSEPPHTPLTRGVDAVSDETGG